MKYIAVLDDAFLSNFRLDDEDKLTLVVTDKYGGTRAVRLKPLVTHVLTTEEGESAYLTKGHIDAMKKYEETQERAEMRVKHELNRVKDELKEKNNE